VSRAESTGELAERGLRHGEGETQVTVVRERSLLARFARSQPTQATEIDDVTVSFLSLHDGHTGAAETNDLSDDALAAAARRAAAAARAAARAAGAPGDYPGLPEPAEPSGHDGFDPETARLDPGSAGAQLQAAFGACAERGLQAFGIWTAGRVDTAIATTAGARLREEVTDGYMKVIARDEAGRSGWAADATSASGQLDGAALARRAAAKVGPGEPVDLAPGEYPVVLEPDAVGWLLDLLGYLAFNGLSHTEGRGALAGRLGTRVAAPAINLSDSPRFAGTLPRAFDAEGVSKAPIPLIQDGVAHAVVHDSRSAAHAGDGARSTGHALVPGGAPYGPHPTNLVLIGGGAADEHELAAPIERGLYVTRLWYVNVVHEKSTLLTGMTRDGTYLIEDGRITRPVKDLRFTQSMLEALSGTEAVGSGSKLQASGELFGCSRVPALRLRAFTFSS